ITICLNSEKFLEETILSVLNQSYKNIEYIIIDGGSTDGTLDIIKRYEDRIDYWVSEPDKGISDAFNKGILASKGDIIGFLNSQDYYFSNDVIQKIAGLFNTNPGAGIVYGKTYYVPVNSSEIVGVMGERFTEERMRKRNIMPHQSVFTKREVFDQFGLFRLEYKIVMDYEFLLRATKSYTPFFLDEGLAVMTLGGISDTDKFTVCTELFKAQIANKAPLLSSLTTLICHYLTSAGLRLLRFFNIYTLRHLYKKVGLINDVDGKAA
ncbi:MAG: glycosyltransferase family 2 protein, partial [Thermodesulfovibrionales bacterium]|nr:glycosyltransferase family 2 protein [Thermodesulfovibrionales bacterium]